MVDDRTSLYRYFDDGGALIYVGITGRGIARNVEHDKTKCWLDEAPAPTRPRVVGGTEWEQ